MLFMCVSIAIPAEKASDVAETQVKTDAPAEAAVENWTLDDKAARHIYESLGGDGIFISPYRLDILTVESESCRVCFKGKAEEIFCAVISHAEEATAENPTVSSFKVVPEKDEVAEGEAVLWKKLQELVLSLPADLWVRNIKPFDERGESLKNLLSIFDMLLASELNAATPIAQNLSDFLKNEFPEKTEYSAYMELLRLVYLEGGDKPEAGLVLLDDAIVRNTVPAIAARLAYRKARLLEQTGKADMALDAYSKLDFTVFSPDLSFKILRDMTLLSIKTKGLDEGMKIIALHKEEFAKGGKTLNDSASRLLDEIFNSLGIESGHRAAPFLISLLPDSEALNLTYIDHLLEAGLTEDALKAVDAAMQKKPDASGLFIRKAMIVRQMNLPDEALPLLEKAYYAAPTEDRRNLLSLWSAVAREKEDYSDDYARLKQRYEADPADVFPAFGYAVFSFYDGDYETSRKIMDDLVIKIPESERVYIYGGMSRYHLGDKKGAVEWLERFNTEGRSSNYDFDIHYCRSIVYYPEQRERAVREMEIYLSRPIIARSESLEKKEWSVGVLEQMRRGERILHPHWIPAYQLLYMKIAAGVAAVFAIAALLLVIVAVRRRKSSGSR